MRYLVLALFLTLVSLPAQATEEHLLRMKSAHPVNATLDKLATALESKGITIFARIDHAAGAASVDQDLNASQVLIFGNPRLGTPLMQENPEIGVDLPLKALAYEDDAGDVWLIYTDPARLAARYGLPADHPVIEKMTGALANFTAAATAE
jgi:uncharacterized protein (DUF302 family)